VVFELCYHIICMFGTVVEYEIQRENGGTINNGQVEYTRFMTECESQNYRYKVDDDSPRYRGKRTKRWQHGNGNVSTASKLEQLAIDVERQKPIEQSAKITCNTICSISHVTCGLT